MSSDAPAPDPSRRILGLPYHSVLSWQAFELFCADLLYKSGEFDSIQNYGTTGYAQKGIDILARHDGEVWAFQCKRVKRFTPSEFDRLMAETIFEAARYVLIVSFAPSTALMDRVAANPKWILWSASDLDRRVENLGSDAFELVTLYFGRDWARSFLGKAAASVFLSPERFFAPFAQTNSIVSLDGPFINQVDALSKLNDFLSSSDHRALVLTGPIGTGKTKLLYEFTSALNKEQQRRIVFVREGSVLDDSVMEDLSSEASVVIVDDPARVTRLDNLMSHLARSGNAKLILGALAGSEVNAAYQLQAFGMAPSSIVVGPAIKPLKRAEAMELAAILTDVTDAKLLELIHHVSSGVPLIIRIIAELLRAGEPDLLDTLRNERYPVDIIMARYQRVLAGQIANAMTNAADALSLMRVIAALGPVDVRTRDFRKAVCSYFGWDDSKLLEALAALESAGITMRFGSRSRIVPDILRIFILKQACSVNGVATAFAADLVAHFGFRRQLLLNLATTDLVANQEEQVFEPIWTTVLGTIKESFAYERAGILDEIKDLSYVVPGKMLELAEFVINNPAEPDPAQPLKDFHEVTNADVLRPVPEMLRGIALSSIPYVRMCVRLLWELSKRETTTFSSRGAFETLVDLASYGRYKSLDLNLEVLEEISDLSREQSQNTFEHLPIDAIAPVLARSFENVESTGGSLTISRFAVSPKNVATVRRKAISILVESLRLGDSRVAVKAIDMLVRCVQHPELPLGTDVDVEQLWKEEQLRILDLLEQVMGESADPILRLRIATELSWHAFRNSDAVIRARVRILLADIEGDPDLDLYAALFPHFARHLPSIEPGASFDRLQEAIEGLLDRTTSRLFDEGLSPKQLLALLARIFADYLAAGLAPTAAWLFLKLSNRDLTYAEAVAREICESYRDTFGTSISAILSASWIRDGAIGYELANLALNTGSQRLQIAVGQALWYSDNVEAAPRIDAERRAEVLSKLLAIPDPGVQEAALHAVGTLLKADAKLAVNLLIQVDAGENSKLADEIFANLRTVDLADLDENTSTTLIRRLIAVNELDYWAFEFLRKAAPNRANAVLDLFVQRILSVERSEKRRVQYKPVPYAHSLIPHISRFFEALMLSPDQAGSLLESAYASKGMSRYWFAELFGSLTKHPEPVVRALTPWVESGSAERVEFAAAMLHRVEPEFVFQHRDLIVKLIEAATVLGDSCVTAVEGSLFTAAISGARSGVAFEPMPQDTQLLKNSQRARTELDAGSRAERFYRRLEEYAGSEIQLKAERDVDLLGEPE